MLPNDRKLKITLWIEVMTAISCDIGSSECKFSYWPEKVDFR